MNKKIKILIGFIIFILLTLIITGCDDTEAVEQQRFEKVYYQNDIAGTDLTIIKDTETEQKYIMIKYRLYQGGGVSITPLIEEVYHE